MQSLHNSNMFETQEKTKLRIYMIHANIYDPCQAQASSLDSAGVTLSDNLAPSSALGLGKEVVQLDSGAV